jgi:hypothetical protein
MSEPRHRLEPASASVFASYPPPNVRSIDFDAVAPSRTSTPPERYVAAPAVRTPSGDGPDQWAEEPVPESTAPEAASESDDLALATS